LGAARVDSPQAKPVETAAAVELLSHNVPVPVSQNVPVRVLWMEVTAYCPCEICCGKGAMGLTASGRHVSYNNGQFVAADTDVLPFGTKLLIPGYSDQTPIEVIDRGGAIKGQKLDVFFDSHQRALQWGRQWLPVAVVN
jgi:3D (Asp-Asp-Asp) domain-containing protein